MPRQNWITESPTISVLRNRTGSSSGTVTTEMHIQLQASKCGCLLINLPVALYLTSSIFN